MTSKAPKKAVFTPLPADVAIYMVGGAVRDQLLDLPVHDRDWVVVGATPELMAAHGFTPVGKDFPVFLHPQSHEEYALARTERKSGLGYKGFTIYADQQVSIEEDLARRDLTINAIAMRSLPDGRQEWVDPYQGQQDLQRKVLRHVTAAFAEDPLRILRIARFAARFTEFEVAAETMALMQQMVAAGEVAHLVPERVWQELARGLMETAPTRMLQVLRDCGALTVILPEWDAQWQHQLAHDTATNAGERSMQRLQHATQAKASLAVRFAVLTVDLDRLNSHASQTQSAAETLNASKRGLLKHMAERLRLPSEIRDLAILVAQESPAIANMGAATTATHMLDLFERSDAFRRPERFAQLLQACTHIAIGQSGNAQANAQSDAMAKTTALLQAALRAAQQVNTAAIAQAAAKQGIQGQGIGQAIQQARIDAVAHMLNSQTDH